jgi:hypothetical protein
VPKVEKHAAAHLFESEDANGASRFTVLYTRMAYDQLVRVPSSNRGLAYP